MGVTGFAHFHCSRRLAAPLFGKMEGGSSIRRNDENQIVLAPKIAFAER